MIKPKVGFIVYGVHKDGLADPMGTPFIDDDLIKKAKKALKNAGMDLVEHDLRTIRVPLDPIYFPVLVRMKH